LHEMEGCGAQADAEKEALRARTRSKYKREGGETSGDRGGDCQRWPRHRRLQFEFNGCLEGGKRKEIKERGGSGASVCIQEGD
jgi:hypothetical protein